MFGKTCKWIGHQDWRCISDSWNRTQTPLYSWAAVSRHRHRHFKCPRIGVTFNVTNSANDLATAVADEVSRRMKAMSRWRYLPPIRRSTQIVEPGFCSQISAPSLCSTIGLCRVRPANEFTIDRCLFADNKNKLIAVRDENWKLILISSFIRPFRPVWQRKWEQDLCKGDQGSWNQRTCGAWPTSPRRGPQNYVSVLKPSALIAQAASITRNRRNVGKSTHPNLGAPDRIKLNIHNDVISRKNSHREQNENALCAALVVTKTSRDECDAQLTSEFHQLLTAWTYKVVVWHGSKRIQTLSLAIFYTNAEAILVENTFRKT